MRSARCCWPAAPSRACVAPSRSSRTNSKTPARESRWRGREQMKIDVLTLFPEMFKGPLDVSMVQRAREARQLELRITDLRDYTHDRHKTVDDRPFGGGPGMVLKCEPIFEAVENLATEQTRVILMTPAGRLFNQA